MIAGSRAGLADRQSGPAAGRLAAPGALIVLTVITGLAWWVTLRDARSMSSMVQGLAGVGRAMAFTTQPAEFMGMWAAMMVAMMLPAVTPAVLRRLRAPAPASPRASVAFFLAGYLAIWIALGAAAFGALVAMGHLGRATGWVERSGGAAFIVAGLYEFTHWKRQCLRACARSDHASARTASSRPNPLAAGVLGGLSCAGACWALMALLLVVGVMNIPWMAALTIAFVLEHQRTLTAPAVLVIGASAAAFGIAVLAHPSVLGTVTGS
jgi:predicted metal-binding membrane protein